MENNRANSKTYFLILDAAMFALLFKWSHLNLVSVLSNRKLLAQLHPVLMLLCLSPVWPCMHTLTRFVSVVYSSPPLTLTLSKFSMIYCLQIPVIFFSFLSARNFSHSLRTNSVLDAIFPVQSFLTSQTKLICGVCMLRGSKKREKRDPDYCCMFCNMISVALELFLLSISKWSQLYLQNLPRVR